MAGLTAAWRLSEAGWRDELESITVYQRGWRLGGKGASSRGPNGRIEEHGLHLWLGYYENAFRLLRECYAELDRPHTDPEAPIQTWRDAFFPAATVGLEDRRADGWHHWLGQFTPNDLLPGEPDGTRRELTLGDVLRRALQLIVDFLDSLPDDATASGAVSLTACAEAPAGPSPLVNGVRVTVLAAILEAATLARGALDRSGVASSVRALDRALAAAAEAIAGLVEGDADLRRTWHLVAVMTAVARGMLADGIVVGQPRLPRAERRGLPRLDRAPRRAARGRRLPLHPRALRPGLRRGRRRAIAARGERRAWRSSSARRCSSSTAARSSGRWRRAWATSSSPRSTRRCAPAACASSSSTASTGCTSRATARASRPSPSGARRAWRPGSRPTSRWRASAACPGSRRPRSRNGSTRRRASSTRRSSRTSATGPTPRRASCATARTSTRSSSPSRSAWLRSSAAS